MDKLVDWRDFELFVRDMYAEDGDLIVEHDVTEVGKSGARRQIDVKISQTRGLHTYTTLVECKRWKDPIDRHRIDVLAASISDLNASKGVLFTTTGFEDGAEAYAKHMGIDLFVVRDLRDEEWGHLGRSFCVYLHMYNAALEYNLRATLMTAPGLAPPTDLGLVVGFEKDAPEDSAFALRNADGSVDGNLRPIIQEARRRAFQLLMPSVGLMDEGAEEAARRFRMQVEVDFAAAEHRVLHRPYGGVFLNQIELGMDVTVSQSRLDFDRGQYLDLALAVENFVTNKRHVVTKHRDEASLVVRQFVDGDPGEAADVDDEANRLVVNGDVFRVITEIWVGDPEPPAGTEFAPTKKVRFVWPSWETTIEEPVVDTPDDASSSDEGRAGT